MRSLNIISVHNRYLMAGGEDQVFESEARLLRDYGHTVTQIEEQNAYPDSVAKKIGMAVECVWSRKWHREFRERLQRERPDVVQRFLDASFEGWHAYLDGDPAPANALIKADNPEMTDALLAYGRNALKQHAIVETNPGAATGIGRMTEARWRSFFDSVQKDGGYPADLDLSRAYTLQFLGKPNP